MTSRSSALCWCYTLNNPVEDEESRVLDPLCCYHVYGVETGESGTRHLQGYVKFLKRMRLPSLKTLLPRAHWECARGTPSQNREYCSKDGQVYEYGELPLTGSEATKEKWKRTRMLAEEGRFSEIDTEHYLKYERAIKSIRRDYQPKPSEVSELPGIWLHGHTGAGKSRTVRDVFGDVYVKPATKWWDGYNDEEYALIEDWDRKTQKLGRDLKIWGDHYPFPAEQKGTTIIIRPKKVIVTSQYRICDVFSEEQTVFALERRFMEIEVTKDNVEHVKEVLRCIKGTE